MWRRRVFGPRVLGYPAEVSEGGKRALMQVDPARLVELATSCEVILAEMAHDWQAVTDELADACAALGDATGTLNVAASYVDTLTDASEVVTAMTQALVLGVAGLVDAAEDAARTDDVVAAELQRTAHQVAADEGFGTMPGRGGR
jgi:ABC-type transporter Mla subunit MlaD